MESQKLVLEDGTYETDLTNIQIIDEYICSTTFFNKKVTIVIEDNGRIIKLKTENK